MRDLPRQPPVGLPSRLGRQIKAGLTFRWLRRVPDVRPGKRQQRRLARRKAREQRLAAERLELQRRLLAAVEVDRAKRARRARARAFRRGWRPKGGPRHLTTAELRAQLAALGVDQP